jgi:XRE family aerobic/anaerobic benzoate catabolism transcriptional regulator
LQRNLSEHERAVTSAAGGIVAEAEAFGLLLACCYTVWLRAQPGERVARVIAQGDLRPMVRNEEAMQELRQILAAREPSRAAA